VDGKLNEACWGQAAVASDFVLLGEQSYAPEPTEVRVLWDDSHLYIGFRCFDSDIGSLKKWMKEQDTPAFGVDYVEAYPGNPVEIFLIPPENPILAQVFPAERYFQFCANPRGARYDGLGLAKGSWDGRWTAQTSLHPDRWEVELALPWTTLQTKPTEGSVWAINFNRGGGGWSPTRGTFHDPDRFGQIIFLDQWPEPGSRVMGPEITARVIRPLELDPLLARISSLLEEARTKLRTANRGPELPATAATRAAIDEAIAKTETAQRALKSLPSPEIVATWEMLQGRYEKLLEKVETLVAQASLYASLNPAQRSGDEPIPDFHTFLLPAITNERVIPRRWPTHVQPGRTMKLTACPDEYESGSFGIYALADLKGLGLRVTDLEGPAGTVPAGAVDLRVVKVWYQGGRSSWFTHSKLLTPELLLKDDGLVRIDEDRQVNILKMDPDQIRDAEALQPFEVPEETIKQCWVTVHVPPGQKAGTYQGAIHITPAVGAAAMLPVELRVLPFELDEPKIICSMYYRAHLGASTPQVTSEVKTEQQLLAEFKDMRAHGLLHPNVYQGPERREDGTYDFSLLQRYLDLRQQAGLQGGPLLMVGVGVGSEPELLEQTIALAQRNGFSDVYFMAGDEQRGDALRAQRPLFQQVHEAGGKVFVACFGDAYSIVGDLLDLPIFLGLDAALGQAFHTAGQLIGSYGNPQGGVEEPETYRRQYGLKLWKAGYDCACTYAYQHSFGQAWDDYDFPSFRDHHMAYPTVNGVIPTIQWEGYREGYDDLRYLSTLENLIEKAQEREGPAAERARTVQLWLRRIDPNTTPLDEIRAGFIERILALRDILPGGEP